MTPVAAAFIQARMSSRRFPGKVLAPFRGRPVLAHVIDAVRSGVPDGVACVVATSDTSSDDPVAAYASSLGVPVFRGILDDVYRRFKDCLGVFPAARVLRVCADSPLLDPIIIRRVFAEGGDASIDVVTTVFPRTFPAGQNVELIAARLLSDPPADLTAEDREHVTRYFYRHADRYRIVNVRCADPAAASRSMVVDTLDDLRRLESMPE